MYSAVTKAHTLRRSDSWPHHKSFLPSSFQNLHFSSCASCGVSWIFHIPSTFFLSPARKAGLTEALLKILCTQYRSILKRQVKFGMYLLVFSQEIFLVNLSEVCNDKWHFKNCLRPLSYPVTSDKHVLPLKSWKVWSNIRNSLSLNLIKFAQQLKAAAVESFCLQNAQLQQRSRSRGCQGCQAPLRLNLHISNGGWAD